MGEVAGSMNRKYCYGVAVSEEYLGENAPVPYQGSIEKGIIKASEQGFDCVELQIREPASFNIERLKAISLETGVEIAAFGTGLEYSLGGLSFTSPDVEIRKKIRKRFFEFIEIASELDAIVFLGLCRGSSPVWSMREEYLERLYNELIPLVEAASKNKVILAFEPVVFYLTNLLNSTEETLEFLTRPGLEDVQLLLDTHHMSIEDKNMERAFTLCQGKIAHIHISDSNRRYPGSGNIDYDLISNVLDRTGYRGCLSLEVLPFPSGEDAAVKGLAYMKSRFEKEGQQK
jgi:sugar phosphate isomerase/epimerase